MNKWEYMIVRVASPNMNAGYDNMKVIHINGKEIIKEKSSFSRDFFTGGEDFWTFLKEVGDKGWELISHPGEFPCELAFKPKINKE